jgi:hypothetical protein
VSEEVGAEASAPPEAFVRVRTISNVKSFKRHLLRMFDQGQTSASSLAGPPQTIAQAFSHTGKFSLASHGGKF